MVLIREKEKIMFIVTDEFIELGKSDFGDWNEQQLRILGITCPPGKGWFARAIGNTLTPKQKEDFLSLKNG